MTLWILLVAQGAETLGTRITPDGVEFHVYSANATRLELCLFNVPFGEGENVRISMTRDAASGVWSTTVRDRKVLYYGYRAWGAGWTYDPSWKPGSSTGFVADVDKEGGRFNPNKLLLDPYAREVSHDPLTPQHLDPAVYATGPKCRHLDSGPVAPKGVVFPTEKGDWKTKPTRPFKDDLLYEVHLRGFTMNDPEIPAKLRGTYAGAALKAPYLKELGVTAVEFLPIHEFQNDANDVKASTEGDNYWGYMTLNYFAPDRRYASDKTPGGPTREFREMVRGFHEQGIKVILDVVYNHTGEGGPWDKTGDVVSLFSWRGLDNRTYYQLTWDLRFYWDNTGCGGNLNCAHPVVRNLILDSLHYWTREMGVDGFRFDLAPVLGNTRQKEGFLFDGPEGKNALNRAVRELPARPPSGGDGVDLIAETWGIGDGTYQQGNFPSGWAEWNGRFRDTIRKAQNKLGAERVTPGDLAGRFAGSSDLFEDDGRKPWHSVNYLVSHDGFTLRDLYSYNAKNNRRAWPYGPSDGGDDHNHSWDSKGNAALQRQAARTGLALLLLSAGVPMITGGDELYRTQYGNNNAYNLDSVANWIDWVGRHAEFHRFARAGIAFRGAHPALRPAEFFRGKDANGNGIKDITWLKEDGAEADSAYMQDGEKHFLAYRIDGTEFDDSAVSIYVGYNGWSGVVTATIPPPLNGRKWYWAGDTSAPMEGTGNFKSPGEEKPLPGSRYGLAPRSVLVLVEK